MWTGSNIKYSGGFLSMINYYEEMIQQQQQSVAMFILCGTREGTSTHIAEMCCDLTPFRFGGGGVAIFSNKLDVDPQATGNTH